MNWGGGESGLKRKPQKGKDRALLLHRAAGS